VHGVAVQQRGDGAGQVDAELGHGGDDALMNSVRGLAAG